MSEPTIDEIRLPDHIRPLNYQLRLVPDFEAKTFSGSVIATLEVDERAESVLLNSDGLEIDTVKMSSVACEFELQPERERLEVNRALEVGRHELEIEFSGAFNENLVGFYLSHYESHGEAGALATTQFEATFARKCFPCWDEPAFKATFDIAIVAPEGMTAIANSSEISRQSVAGGQLITFAQTIAMSSYLVAFVIGPLQMTEPVDVAGTPLRVVHVPGVNSAMTSFALECGEFGLKYFSQYFDIPYPGDKVDLVAIPDFAFGAMENLGCITFRQALLLIDPAQATQTELQRVADVIFHELAHMWFGDLVTMKWWNGLWLNEAFATFMEMKATDAFRPEWKRWVDFGLSRRDAFEIDALASTRPIEFAVTSPEEAEGMFDTLTYKKGAAVVRMLEQHLGPKRFQRGIRCYMDAHAYGNAETTDLWDAIESETGEPVRRIMDSWIFQGGHPVVSVALDEAAVTFSQQRQRFLGSDPTDDQTWSVPIRYRFKPLGGEPVTASVLLEAESMEVALGDTEIEWLVANAGGVSFVRVQYDADTLDKLSFIAEENLAPIERFALVDDTWAAVLAGEATASSFLGLLEALTAETDRAVWARMIDGFGAISRLLSGDAVEVFEDLAHDAFAPALAGLTLTPQDDEAELTRQLRGDLIRAMGIVANDLEIQEEAKRTVAVGQRDPELVEANIMAAALSVVAHLGDDADAAEFLAASDEADTPQARLRYLYALADFPDDHNVAKVRNRILDGSVRSQNAALWIQRALRNRSCGYETWDFVAANWDQLNEILPSSGIVRMVSGVTSLTQPGDAERVAEFFANHPISQANQTLNQILETQRVRTALRQRESDRLNSLLSI